MTPLLDDEQREQTTVAKGVIDGTGRSILVVLDVSGSFDFAALRSG
jgi:hypothetical protein